MVDCSERTEAPLAIHEPGVYRIRVSGRVGPEWAERIAGLKITTLAGGSRGSSELNVRLADQADLIGLLDQLYNAGCALFAVELLERVERSQQRGGGGEI